MPGLVLGSFAVVRFCDFCFYFLVDCGVVLGFWISEWVEFEISHLGM